jgi:hypothetical protein
LYNAKVIINPDAIYLCQWDPSTSADVDVVSSTSTATTIATCDDNLDGSWIYCNSGTGVGQLAFVGAASTTVLTLDTTTAYTTTPDSTTDILIIRGPWQPNCDFDATYTMAKSTVATTGLVLCLEPYVESATIPFGPLRPRQHHMKTGLNSDGVRFYSDLYPYATVWNQSTAYA